MGTVVQPPRLVEMNVMCRIMNRRLTNCIAALLACLCCRAHGALQKRPPEGFFITVARLFDLLSRQESVSAPWITYDAQGIKWPEAIRTQGSCGLDRLVNSGRKEALAQLVLNKNWRLYFGPVPYQLRKVALFALFKVSPRTAYEVACKLLFNMREASAFSLPLFREPPKTECWPSLPRMAFYFIVRTQDDRVKLKHFVQRVLRETVCPLAACDSFIFLNATEAERTYYLKNGDWPDPRRVCRKGFLRTVLERLEKMKTDTTPSPGESKKAGRDFPDLPVFWFLQVWQGPAKACLLRRLIANEKLLYLNSPRRTWQELAYAELVRLKKTEIFRSLLSGDIHPPATRALAWAGMLQTAGCEAAAVLQKALGSYECVATLYEGDIGQTLFMGIAVLRRAFCETGEKQDCRNLWLRASLRLCLGGRQPFPVKRYVALKTFSEAYKDKPLGAFAREAELMIEALEAGLEITRSQTGEQSLRLDWQEVACLACSRTQRAFNWIMANKNSIDLLELVRCCRYFGPKHLLTVQQALRPLKPKLVSEIEKTKLWLERRETARRIHQAWRKGRLDLGPALLEISALGEPGLAFLLDLLRFSSEDMPEKLKMKVLRTVKRLDPWFPENLIKEAILRDLEGRKHG